MRYRIPVYDKSGIEDLIIDQVQILSILLTVVREFTPGVTCTYRIDYCRLGQQMAKALKVEVTLRELVIIYDRCDGDVRPLMDHIAKKASYFN